MMETDSTPVYQPIPVNTGQESVQALDSIDDEKTIFIDDHDFHITLFNYNTQVEHQINSFPVIIGRDATADIVLEGKSVSRKHAIIEITENNQLVIRDLNSTNGIKVEGQKTPQLLLLDQTDLQIGEYKLSLTFNQAESSAQNNILPVSEASQTLAMTPEKWKRYGLILGSIAALGVISLMALNYSKNKAIDSRVVENVSQPQENVSEKGPDSEAQQNSAKSENLNSQDQSSATEAAVLNQPSNVTATAVETDTSIQDSLPDAVTADQLTTGSNTNETELQGDVAETKVEVEEKKPIRRSPAWSMAYINNSYNYYLDGNASEAIRRLGILSRSARHQQRFKDLALEKRNAIAALEEKYNNASNAYNTGNLGYARTQFNEFLGMENELQFERSSNYYLTAQNRLASISSQRTQIIADPAKEWVLEEGKKLYLQGYRIEKTNINQAKEYWRKVLEILPPESEYYQKAKAKLRLYERIEN